MAPETPVPVEKGADLVQLDCKKKEDIKDFIGVDDHDEDYLFRIQDLDFAVVQGQDRKLPKKDKGNVNNVLQVAVDGAEQLVLVPMRIKGLAGLAMVDSGAQLSLIRAGILKRLGLLGEIRENTRISLRDVQGKQLATYGFVLLEVVIGGEKMKVCCYVVEKLPHDLVLGRPALRQNGVTVKHGEDILQLRSGTKVPMVSACEGRGNRVCGAVLRCKKTVSPGGVAKLRLRGMKHFEKDRVYELRMGVKGQEESETNLKYFVLPRGQSIHVLVGNDTEEKVTFSPADVSAVLIPAGKVDEYLSMDEEEALFAGVTSVETPGERKLPEDETEEDIWRLLKTVEIGNCGEETKGKVRALLWKYHPLFARNKWDIGRVNLPGFAHTIRLREGAVPKRFAPYRVSHSEREVAEKFVERMRGARLISDAKGEWALPLMLLSKPDDPRERRPVVNCKYLNTCQIAEATYLPRIDDLLDRFSRRHKFISKMDLCQFFFQIPLDEKSKEICSFATPVGNFSSEVMLQGDCNAPAEAQRLLMRVLEGVPGSFCLIDDIGLVSETEEGHLGALEEIFKRMMEIGLTMRADKLVLMADELTFLGHTVKKGGEIKITEDKVSAVQQWPRCRTVTEVRAFLGFTSFVRKFVRSYSQMALPLIELVKKERLRPGDWNKRVEEAFQAMKKAVTEAPCLAIPDPKGGDFHLFVDASGQGLGYVLAQAQEEEGKKFLKPCAFGSRLFRGAEVRYSIPEKETLAAAWAIKKNRPYLFGRVFRLHTDSEAVYHVLRRQSAEPLTSRLSRFAVDVMGFSFHVHHVRTEKNWADALSRLPTVENPETGELSYRRDEQVFLDPFPPPVEPEDIEVDPLWVSPVVTRGQALDAEVGPHFREEQRRDPEIEDLRAWLEVQPNKRGKKGRLIFKLVDGVVYAVDRRRRSRFYVPLGLCETVLIREHTVGHLGAKKMVDSMRRKYYWRKMEEEVLKFVRECVTCQTCKAGAPPGFAPLKALPRPERPQDVLALDVKGPLPPSKGKQYILVAVDLFSRLAYTKAVTHVDGKVVVEFLVKEVFKFGVPRVLITDNARNLSAGVGKYMYEKFGIEHRTSIPLFASSNGGVERLIGTIGKMLRCASLDDTRGWADWVQEVTAEYNVATHRGTKFMPFEVHFGYTPNKIGDLGQLVEGYHLSEPERYLREVQQRRAKVLAAIKKGEDLYYGENKRDYDRRKRAAPHLYEVGDWVMVKKVALGPGESRGLGPKYIGPAEVTWVSDTSARVVFLNNNQERLRSVSHLKPFFGSPEGERADLFTGPEGDGNGVDRLTAAERANYVNMRRNNDEDEPVDEDEDNDEERRVRFRV